MPNSLILFGSVARGSETATSDVDMLAVGGDALAFSIKSNGIEIQNYTVEKFMSLAREGDLFGAHIAMEGKAIFDPHGLFLEFREAFTLKESYKYEKECAFDLSRFLMYYGAKFQNKDLVARRIAWAVRTVLIATLAEKRKFVFSPEGLYREFPYRWVEKLINLRRGGAERNYTFEMNQFLLHFGEFEPRQLKNRYYERFKTMKNSVALGTLRQLKDQVETSLYPESGRTLDNL